MLFHGDDDADQLVRITKILGTEDLKTYVAKYGMKIKKKDHPNLTL